MYRELRHNDESGGSVDILGDEHSGLRPAKSFASAAWGVALKMIYEGIGHVVPFVAPLLG
jgi:hypothetical protein